MTTWRSAWRSLRKAAGLDHVRFHDGRHTALTRLAEKGQPDWVIQAQMGHVSMMRTYSPIRRKALDEAAAALEPTFKLVFPRHKPKKPTSHETYDRLMSQFTSQWEDLKKEIRKNSKGIGSPHWTISATGWSEKRRKWPVIDRFSKVSRGESRRASLRRLRQSAADNAHPLPRWASERIAEVIYPATTG